MTGDSERLISKLVALHLHLSLSLTCIFFPGSPIREADRVRGEPTDQWNVAEERKISV